MYSIKILLTFIIGKVCLLKKPFKNLFTGVFCYVGDQLNQALPLSVTTCLNF